MRNWKVRLDQKKVLIADGGWGTEFMKRGLKPGEAPEIWNLQRPDEVRAVALSYVEAGAEIILTNTFGGSPIKLAKMGLEGKMEEINRRGSEISRQAAGDRALVFASIGPTGGFLPPLGTLGEADLIRAFAAQARAIAAGGADGIVIETMMDLGEAKAALRAVKDHTSLPVAVTMTFEKKARGYFTMMGLAPDRAVSALEQAGADIVGANCGAGIDQMVEVAREMRRETSLPIWCKPNAGLPELVNGLTVYREPPEAMASKLKDLMEAGARIIGGCCGTSPAHIRALVQARDKILARS